MQSKAYMLLNATTVLVCAQVVDTHMYIEAIVDTHIYVEAVDTYLYQSVDQYMYLHICGNMLLCIPIHPLESLPAMFCIANNVSLNLQLWPAALLLSGLPVNSCAVGQ